MEINLLSTLEQGHILFVCHMTHPCKSLRQTMARGIYWYISRSDCNPLHLRAIRRSRTTFICPFFPLYCLHTLPAALPRIKSPDEYCTESRAHCSVRRCIMLQMGRFCKHISRSSYIENICDCRK